MSRWVRARFEANRSSLCQREDRGRSVSGPPSRRVLVADDEPSIVDAAATALSYEGYDVSTARNGREALTSVQSNPPTSSCST